MSGTADLSTCESCGEEVTTVALVQRLYVTPEAWDAEGRIDLAELEWWCVVCRTHYPHVDPAVHPDGRAHLPDPPTIPPSEPGPP